MSAKPYCQCVKCRTHVDLIDRVVGDVLSAEGGVAAEGGGAVAGAGLRARQYSADPTPRRHQRALQNTEFLLFPYHQRPLINAYRASVHRTGKVDLRIGSRPDQKHSQRRQQCPQPHHHCIVPSVNQSSASASARTDLTLPPSASGRFSPMRCSRSLSPNNHSVTVRGTTGHFQESHSADGAAPCAVPQIS